MSKARHRIPAIDIARSIAILLAMLSHSISAYNGGEHLYSPWLQLALRPATATFILLFGTLMELNYARKYRERGPAAAASALFSRAIQCYVLYVFSCAVLSLVEGYSLAYFLRMALLLGATPYTDILKFYAVILLLSPLLLRARIRWGLPRLALACLAVHVIHFLFYPLPFYEDFPGSRILFGFLYGATTDIAGPSVLHGLTFVITGMWLGHRLQQSKGRRRLLDAQHPQVIALLGLCLLLLIAGWSSHDEGNFFYALATLHFRNSNSYVYFAFGIACAILILDACLRLSAHLGHNATQRLTLLGKYSLFIFCFGNVLLYLTRAEGLSDDNALAATVASFFGGLALVYGFDRLNKRMEKAAGTPTANAFRFITKGYADSSAKWAARQLYKQY